MSAADGARSWGVSLSVAFEDFSRGRRRALIGPKPLGTPSPGDPERAGATRYSANASLVLAPDILAAVAESLSADGAGRDRPAFAPPYFDPFIAHGFAPVAGVNVRSLSSRGALNPCSGARLTNVQDE